MLPLIFSICNTTSDNKINKEQSVYSLDTTAWKYDFIYSSLLIIIKCLQTSMLIQNITMPEKKKDPFANLCGHVGWKTCYVLLKVVFEDMDALKGQLSSIVGSLQLRALIEDIKIMF